jgi:integrase
MMLVLKKWKVACPPNELDLVFPNSAGKPMDHKNMMNRHYFPALMTAGLQKIRFHDLRHTYASLKIHQGANIKYIQKQMGHAKPTITLNVYAHLLEESNPHSAQELENAVLGI